MDNISDLTTATNEELVAELVSRKTFSGIILRQASEFLGEWKKLWKWDCSNNISHTKASEILETIADQIRKESPQDPPSKD